MPVQKVIKNGKIGYRWGKSGKIYLGKNAEKMAARQGRAIKSSQRKRKS